MKYCCDQSCGSVLNTLGTIPLSYSCPYCVEGKMIPIHNYETPEQYEKRTGKLFPDNGVVWYKQDGPGANWDYGSFRKAKAWQKSFPPDDIWIIIIADPPVPPPDNWKPEASK